MTLRKRLAALALAGSAALTAGLVTASPASAIDRVDDATCGGHYDFYTVYNEGKLCFANDGSTGVAIYDVWELDSGNNTSRTGVTQNGSSFIVNLGSWQGRQFTNGFLTVNWIDITGR
ncbi:beta/gamma crystallin domain-containing protein [Kitasatospora azatica]|uniref:beta/gamma crystallin domain-containing protein n=1 Tax=Kitasatospora azatica TaxID=58347 RepID=UPI000563B094|nr:hypothetical protein [Kitasatospora azatica]